MEPYYDKDGITIYHGDCIRVLKLIPPGMVDLVVTDPPYGVGYAEWDDDIQPLEWLNMCIRKVPLVMFTPGNGSQYKYPAPSWTLCWARPGSVQRAGGGGFSHWEPILVYGKNRMQVDFKMFSPNADDQNHGHPCSKPLSVMRWLIGDASKQGDLVLDPFMGSGTTLVAARELGRRAVGIEINEEYCEIAVKRLAKPPSLWGLLPRPEPRCIFQLAARTRTPLS